MRREGIDTMSEVFAAVPPGMEAFSAANEAASAAITSAGSADSAAMLNAAAAALNLMGPAAALSETRCEPVFHELDIPTWVIGGGTLEIQLNTIATFVLGLPRR